MTEAPSYHSVEELLAKLSEEFDQAGSLVPLQRARIRARLSAEMRELHELLKIDMVLGNLKRDFPDVYAKIMARQSGGSG